ncbi:MAG TPA: type II toxin-antitoxin system RelE/ParE family toxin [Rhizomicrobium sp.]|nr:type II toxin-antitoxin system RelE/ParE family toxin [Rhizomicrobium sp.]
MRVRFAPEALSQMADISAYIAQDSASAARKVIQRIEYIAALLGGNPEMGHLISEEGVRVFPVNPYPYLIFYELGEDELNVISVRHGARRRPAFHEPAREFQL